MIKRHAPTSKKLNKLLSDIGRGRAVELTAEEQVRLRARAMQVADRKRVRLNAALERGDTRLAAKIVEDILRQASMKIWATYEVWPRMDAAERLQRLPLVDCFAPVHRVREKRVPKRSGGTRRTFCYSSVDRARQALLRLALSGSRADVQIAPWQTTCKLAVDAVRSAPASARYAVIDVQDAFGSVLPEFVLSLVSHVPAAALRATLLEAFPHAMTDGLEGGREHQTHDGRTQRTEAPYAGWGERPSRAGASSFELQTSDAGRGSPPVGLPQGNSLSGLFAEVALADAMPTLSADVAVLRHVDDFLIIDATADAQAANAVRQSLFEARGGSFRCRPISHGPLRRFTFLGYRFHKLANSSFQEPDPDRRLRFETRLMTKALLGEDVEAAMRGYLAAFALWGRASRNHWTRTWSWRAAQRHDFSRFLPRAA
jgi:hypothetical protein